MIGAFVGIKDCWRAMARTTELLKEIAWKEDLQAF